MENQHLSDPIAAYATTVMKLDREILALRSALQALLSEKYAADCMIADFNGLPEKFDAKGNWVSDSPACVRARKVLERTIDVAPKRTKTVAMSPPPMM